MECDLLAETPGSESDVVLKLLVETSAMVDDFHRKMSVEGLSRPKQVKELKSDWKKTCCIVKEWLRRTSRLEVVGGPKGRYIIQ